MMKLWKRNVPSENRQEEPERTVEQEMPETAVGVSLSQKQRIPLSHRPWAKGVAVVLTLLLSAVTILSLLLGLYLYEHGVYTNTKKTMKETSFYDIAKELSQQILVFANAEKQEEAIAYAEQYNIVGWSITNLTEETVFWEYGDTTTSDGAVVLESEWLRYRDGSIHEKMNGLRVADRMSVQLYVDTTLGRQDDFIVIEQRLERMYAVCYWVIVVAAVTFLLEVLFFLFLMRGSGWHNDATEPRLGRLARVPFDLLTAGCAMLLFLLVEFVAEFLLFRILSDGEDILILLLTGESMVVLLLGWSMNASARFQCGRWWENTVLFRIGQWLHRLGQRLAPRMVTVGKKVLAMGGKTASLLWGNLSLLWKVSAVYAGFAFLDIVLVYLFRYERHTLLLTWLLLHLVEFLLVLSVTLQLRKLQDSGEALARGAWNGVIQTKGMLPVFRAYAENLSRIQEGVNLAVEQRMRSERMKTELITNVSHDIKTPLTSIINYSDLIEKEPLGSERIQEYAAVLHRQSERLKRLIEDLVEASKASTGNLDVQLVPCEVGVLLSQAAGEYEERLTQCGLTLLVQQTETPVRIMADGRRLWRVFDNLMNNICKYAMPATRVYLTLEIQEKNAVIAFKNISREPLNMSTQELTERFVRGDTARNTEGNGLGLSIAQSLTQLQGGTLTITADGDLFKVVLCFPMI